MGREAPCEQPPLDGRRRARLSTAILPGLTLAELAERTGRPRADLAAALASEVRAGRVLTAPDGRFALVAAKFPRDLLDALRGLTAPDVVAAANGNGHLARANGGGGLSATEWSNISKPYY